MTYAGIEQRRGTCTWYMSISIELSQRAEKKRLAYAVAGTKRGDRCRHFLQNYRYKAVFFFNTVVVTTRLSNNCQKPL